MSKLKKNNYTFTGELVIENAAEIKENLQGLLKPNYALHLKFENIDSVDLSFVQIILSLKKYAQQNNIQIVFDIFLPEVHLIFLKKFGIII